MRTRVTFIPILMCLLFNSCRKEYDLPPLRQAANGEKINIAGIKAKYRANKSYTFQSDSNLYAVVMSDERSGNFYKELYLKDATGAIHVNLLQSGGIYAGDSIRINLKGCVLTGNNNLIGLDSLDTERRLVKLASGVKVVPLDKELWEVVNSTLAIHPFQSQLLRLNKVEFKESDRNQLYGDAKGKTTVSRILKSCEGYTLAVRTSAYSNFANQLTPGGQGSITGILSQYGNTLQLLLRNASETTMTGSLCSETSYTNTFVYLSKDFNDGSISSGGWTQVNDTKTVNWTVVTSTLSNGKMAQCNNFISSGTQPACDCWLISPAINLSQSSSPVLSFSTAVLYSGPSLLVYVSGKADPATITESDWTLLSPALADNTQLKYSGEMDLSGYKYPKVYLAFRYQGKLNSGARWQLDNVRIIEKGPG